MKTLFIAILLLISTTSFSQSYEYYFIEFRPTGKAEIAVIPENNINYPGLDSLLCERSENKGKEVVKEKRYPNYSAVFNMLSSKGLEFVQFVTAPKIGGATQMLTGTGDSNYMVWRRKTE